MTRRGFKQMAMMGLWIILAVMACCICITVVYYYMLEHAHPVRVSSLAKFAQISGLKFPKQTRLIDGGLVDETDTIYPDYWFYGVVSMPLDQLSCFLKQQPANDDFYMYNPPGAKLAKKEIILEQKSLEFHSYQWQVAGVNHFEAAHYNGAGGNVFIDLDDPNVATIYIVQGW